VVFTAYLARLIRTHVFIVNIALANTVVDASGRERRGTHVTRLADEIPNHDFVSVLRTRQTANTPVHTTPVWTCPVHASPVHPVIAFVAPSLGTNSAADSRVGI